MKKEAKMGHRASTPGNKDTKDTGRRPTIPCTCGGTMEWAKVNGSMRWVCGSCGLICDK